MTMNKRMLADHNYKWTDTDLQEFSEWLDAWGWKQAVRGIWYQCTSPKIQKTTSQLREDWEYETGRRKP